MWVFGFLIGAFVLYLFLKLFSYYAENDRRYNLIQEKIEKSARLPSSFYLPEFPFGNFPQVFPPQRMTPVISPKNLWNNANEDSLFDLMNEHYKTFGRSEYFFFEYLEKHFKDEISHNESIMKGYKPDFVYSNVSKKIFIDIEIDEPYSFVNNEPLHYLGNIKDKDRNRVFLESGWAIVRFSEEQVLTQPIECCKLIAEIIEKLEDDHRYYQSKFRDGLLNIKHHRIWSNDEAKNMSLIKYRDLHWKNRVRLPKV